jgi:hypothetical protein
MSRSSISVVDVVIFPKAFGSISVRSGEMHSFRCSLKFEWALRFLMRSQTPRNVFFRRSPKRIFQRPMVRCSNPSQEPAASQNGDGGALISLETGNVIPGSVTCRYGCVCRDFGRFCRCYAVRAPPALRDRARISGALPEAPSLPMQTSVWPSTGLGCDRPGPDLGLYATFRGCPGAQAEDLYAGYQ